MSGPESATSWPISGRADRSGVLFVADPLLTADGKGYAYSYGRYLNNLYVVTGLR